MKTFYTLYVNGSQLGQWKIFKSGCVFKARKWRNMAIVSKLAKSFHNEGNSILVTEESKHGIVCSWELESGSDTLIFNDKAV